MATRTARSIAFLAFEGPRDDGELRAFGVGLAEELGYALAGTAGLRVAPPDAGFRHRSAAPDDLAAAVRALGVARGIGGHLARDGEALVLTPRVVDSAGAVSDLAPVRFPADDLIAGLRALLDALAPGLGIDAGAVDLAASLEISDATALRECLLGRFEFRKRSETALARAEAHFRAALARSPRYLGAQVGLYRALSRKAMFWRRDDAALQAALAEALAGLRALDPDAVRLNWSALLPESEDVEFWNVAEREARARAAVLRGRDWVGAEFTARHVYADSLSESGLFRTAIAYLEQCGREEAPNAHRMSLEGQLRGIVGDLGAAEARLRESLRLDDTLLVAHSYLIAVLERLGRTAEADVERERIAPEVGEDLTRAILAHGLWCRGDRTALEEEVPRVVASAVPAFFKGLALLMVDDAAGAIREFERGYHEENRFSRQIREKIPFYFGAARWDELMDVPRFRIMLRTMRLDDRWRTEHARRAAELTPVTGIAMLD